MRALKIILGGIAGLVCGLVAATVVSAFLLGIEGCGGDCWAAGVSGLVFLVALPLGPLMGAAVVADKTSPPEPAGSELPTDTSSEAARRIAEYGALASRTPLDPDKPGDCE